MTDAERDDLRFALGLATDTARAMRGSREATRADLRDQQDYIGRLVARLAKAPA